MRIRTASAVLSATVATLVTVGLVAGTAAAAPAAPRLVPAAGPPTAPGGVTADVVPGGIRVTWAASPPADPALSGYVVTGGIGTCPISVPRDATSAVVPVMPGQTVLTPKVVAVNELGYSAVGQGPTVSTLGVKPSTRYKNVQILQLSDFHGAVEKSSTNIGAAALASAFEADRVTVLRTFTVSAGDNIGAAPAISTEFAEMPTIQAMNLMGFDVSTFGNHEHDRNISHLRSVIDASEFEWVVSNYSDLSPLKVRDKAAKPFTIIERSGVKVGFVGMNTEQTKEQVFPGNLTFGTREIVISPRTSTVNEQVAAAKAAGADIVIALLHQGWAANVGSEPVGRLIDVTRALDGVAVAYGGHSHQTFAAVIDDTPVAMVRNSGQEYTRTQVCYDSVDGDVAGVSVEYVTKAMLGSTPPESAAVNALIGGYKSRLTAKLDVKIGTVSAVFPRGGNPAVERSGQTAMGDYAADALRAKYRTDFALVNGGGIRDTFPARSYTPADASLRRPGSGATGPFDVTLGDALTVFPFGNSAVTTTITGANLWAALENGVSNVPNDGRFPQVSGLRFSFNASRPVGQRVVSVTKADGTPIARDGTVYTLATLDFLVNGGDGYGTLFSPAAATVRDLYVDVFREAVEADARAGRVTVPPVADGRIVRVG
jgi:5'-nucleotidase